MPPDTPSDSLHSPIETDTGPGLASDLAHVATVLRLAQGRETSPGAGSAPKRWLKRAVWRLLGPQNAALEHLAHLAERSLRALDKQETELQSLRLLNSKLEQQTAELAVQREQLAVQQELSSRLADRLAGLALERRAEVTSQSLSAGVTAGPSGDADFDQFYAAFEAAFRGDPELIRQRQSAYLPLLRAALPQGKPVFDLGCGRGEWLQLLKEEFLTALGWEVNDRFVADGRVAGLEIHHGDGLAEIARIAREAPGSLGAITAFHVIEHISFESLLSLMDHALLALHQGGVIIFETPNPENLVVGANTFYTDPTHERPLHPATLAFMAERAGFAQAQSWRLSLARGAPALNCPRTHPQLEPVYALLNRHFAVGPDFALVARKGLALPPNVQP